MAGEKGAVFCNDLLKLIFNAVGIANLADNAGSSPLTNLYVSLHTADPTAAGDQTTDEVSYTSYARVAVARSSSGWTVTGNSVSPVSTIAWPGCTGGTATATTWAAGTASSGTGKILYTGPISPSIAISTGVTPQLTPSTAVTES